MGFQTEFNWVLKLKNSQLKGLEDVISGLAGTVDANRPCFEFQKSGYRTYPVDIPIDLVNEDWEPIARVSIFRLNYIEDKTEGEYEVLKVYCGEEKKVLTNYYQELSRILKQRGAVS